MSLRVAFMGTPAFAVPTLSQIVAQGHEVVGVYTRAPAASGRGMRLTPSPVQRLAESLRLPVLNPAGLRGGEAVATLQGLGADVAVVVAYGVILPADILAVPPLGCLNLHASLLPRWRGAAPIHRAVMAGDAETGVAVMRMEQGLDTGPVGLVERVAIDGEATSGELHDRLAPLGADLMARALAALSRGALRFTPQAEEGVVYARKIANEEARIDWSGAAGRVHDHVRGLSPHPGAFFEADLGRGPERVKVLRSAVAAGSGLAGSVLGGGLVACGEGALRLVQVQRSGKAPMSAEEFWRGARLEPGARLG